MPKLDDSFLYDDEESRLDDAFLYADAEEKEPVKPDGSLRKPDGTPRSSMSARDPSILENITDYFADTEKTKARASNERVAREIAKRDNVPVREVYESIGATRPDSEVDGPGRFQTAAGSFAQGVGSIASSALKGTSIKRQSKARDYLEGMELLLKGEVPTGRVGQAPGGMTQNVAMMRQAEDDGNTERASYLKDIIYKSMDNARKLITEDPGEEELFKAGDKVDKAIKGFIKTNPEFQDDFFTSKVPQGLGTMVSFAAAAALGKGAFTKVGLPGVAGTTIPVAGTGAVMQYTQGFEDALNSGADFKTAIESAERNIPLGYTEAIPLATLFNRLDKGSGGIIKRSVANAMKSGTEEALQETFQTVMSNAIAQDLYDKDRGLWNGAGDGAGVGFTTGGIVAFLGTLIGGRRSVTQQQAEETKIPENKPDQTGQPDELFNPTHKASGGVDVQVATKKGRIIPDTYIDKQGNTIRDANAVPNNPNQSIDVTDDISAVVEEIKADIAGKQGGKDIAGGLPQAEAAIASLEQQNQQTIDSAFAAPAPEAMNQQNMNEISFGKTTEQLRQDEINATFPNEPVMGQQGTAAEIPVTQQEINQKKIDSFAATELAVEPTKTPTEEQVNTEFLSSRDRNLDAIKTATDALELEISNKKKRVSLESASKEIELVRKKITKENNTIGQFLAKAGGLNRAEMESQGVDPESFKGKVKVFGKPLFPRKGGMTSDEVAELLNQQNYQGGNLTANEALDIVFDTLSNDTKFVNSEVEAEISNLDREADNIEQELSRLDIEGQSKAVDISAAADEAATSPNNNLPDPTAAQKEAGNYKKGKTNVQGFDIAIENPAGSKRRPEWPTLKQHYGYIKRTVGADSEPGATGSKIEQVDVFVKPDKDIPKDNPVFIIDQATADGGAFDEHKVMMGFNSEQEARNAYLENYTKGWKGLNQITKASPTEFKDWLENGDTSLEYGHNSKYSESAPRETKVNKVSEASEVTPSKQKVIRDERQDELQNKPSRKRLDEVKGKIEEKAQRDNRVDDELQDKSPVKISDPYQDMRGKDISYQVDVEETGETYTVTVDAGTVMDEIDTRIKALETLRDCI